jgi:hypothetical protein
MMGRSPWFAGIIADFCPLLFSVSRDNAAVQIKGHVVEVKLFEEPPLQGRENGIVSLPGELMKEPAKGAL